MVRAGDRMLGCAERLDGSVLFEARCIQSVLGEYPLVAECAGTVAFALGVVELGASTRTFVSCLLELCFERLHLGFGLRATARVEQPRVPRLEDRQHGLARHDRVAGLELDAEQAPCHRRRDGEALADTRLALFVEGDGDRTGRGLGDLDRLG
jgi:hypothetical protein